MTFYKGEKAMHEAHHLSVGVCQDRWPGPGVQEQINVVLSVITGLSRWRHLKHQKVMRKESWECEQVEGDRVSETRP